jgi:WD40 repeat protein
MAAPVPAPPQKFRVQNTLEGHKWVVTALAFSPDSKVLASGGDGTVRLWDVATSKTIHILPKAGFAPAFSPDGKTLASCGDRRILLWDVASGKKIATIFAGFPVHAVMFSPDGKTLSAIEKNWIVVWDREKKVEVRSWEMLSKPFPVTADNSIKRPVVAICPKGGRLGDDRSFTLIDAFTGKSVLDCAGHEMGVSGVALNRDETMVASAGGGRNPSVRLWKRGTGEHIATFEHPTGTSRCLAFSPEGKILAGGFRNMGIVQTGQTSIGDGFRLYEVPSGKVLADAATPGEVSSLVFSPDGRVLASSAGETIQLWTVPAAWRKKGK